jgi:3-dehydroquinate dehydratase
MKISFVNADHPLICAMMQPETVDEAVAIIANSEYDGAESYGIQLESLRPDQRTEAHLKRLFAACKNRPIYITSYRSSYNKGLSDDECMELLLKGLECGATLGDVMGDLYCPEPMEITYNAEAIEKQKVLIDKIHAMGKEVLISSHLHRFVDEAEVVKIAKEQESRGADICKIVSFATT